MKMKNKLIRCVTLLCAMLMLSGCFGACSKDNGKESNTTAPDIDVSVEDADSEAAQYLPKRFDLGGYTYRMLIDAGVQQDLFAPVDGMGGSIMDQAFYERNLLVEEYFNIEFQAESYDSACFFCIFGVLFRIVTMGFSCLLNTGRSLTKPI